MKSFFKSVICTSAAFVAATLFAVPETRAQQFGLRILPNDDLAVSNELLPNSPGAMLTTRLNREALSTDAPTELNTSSSLSANMQPMQIVNVTPPSNVATNQPVASKFAHKIKPGQQAVPLTAGDKLVYSTRDRFEVATLADALWRAGYSHVTNGTPHFGTDSAGFGERLGSAAFKQALSHVLTNGILAAAMHDDPRYYLMGDGHKFKDRAIYAGTRVIFTRKDDGHQVINYPRLITTFTVAGIENTYYPHEDRGFGETMSTAFTAIALKAAGYEFSEFMGDALHMMHRKKQ